MGGELELGEDVPRLEEIAFLENAPAKRRSRPNHIGEHADAQHEHDELGCRDAIGGAGGLPQWSDQLRRRCGQPSSPAGGRPELAKTRRHRQPWQEDYEHGRQPDGDRFDRCRCGEGGPPDADRGRKRAPAKPEGHAGARVQQARRQGKQQDQHTGTQTGGPGLPGVHDQESERCDVPSRDVQRAVLAHGAGALESEGDPRRRRMLELQGCRNLSRNFVEADVQLVVRLNRRQLGALAALGRDHFQLLLVQVPGELVHIIDSLDTDCDAVARFGVLNLGIEETEAQPRRYARGLEGIDTKHELGRPKRIELCGNNRDSNDEQQQSGDEHGRPPVALPHGALFRHSPDACHRIRYTWPERNRGWPGLGSILCSAAFLADRRGRYTQNRITRKLNKKQDVSVTSLAQ